MANIDTNSPDTLTFKKKNNKLQVRIGVVVFFIIISSLCYFLFRWSLSLPVNVFNPSETFSPLIDQYMSAMQEKNINKAATLFNNPEPDLRDTLQKDFQGVNQSLYTCYKMNEITGSDTNIEGETGTGNISGTIYYDNNFEGFFYASVILTDSNWKLRNIKIFVPPAKVEAYIKDNPQSGTCR